MGSGSRHPPPAASESHIIRNAPAPERQLRTRTMCGMKSENAGFVLKRTGTVQQLEK